MDLGEAEDPDPAAVFLRVRQGIKDAQIPDGRPLAEREWREL